MCVCVCQGKISVACSISVCSGKKEHIHTFCDVFMCLWDKKKIMTAVSVHIYQFIIHL